MSPVYTLPAGEGGLPTNAARRRRQAGWGLAPRV